MPITLVIAPDNFRRERHVFLMTDDVHCWRASPPSADRTKLLPFRSHRATPTAASVVPRGRDGRPALDALCRDAVRGEFDCIIAWSVERLGRSLEDLISFLDERYTAAVDLYTRTSKTSTPGTSGKSHVPNARRISLIGQRG